MAAREAWWFTTTLSHCLILLAFVFNTCTAHQALEFFPALLSFHSLAMNSSTAPQDEPFNHAALARYSTGESSSNLLGQTGNKPSNSDLTHEADSYYDQPDPNRLSAYDPEKTDAASKASEYSRDRSYQDLGVWPAYVYHDKHRLMAGLQTIQTAHSMTAARIHFPRRRALSADCLRGTGIPCNRGSSRRSTVSAGNDTPSSVRHVSSQRDSS